MHIASRITFVAITLHFFSSFTLLAVPVSDSDFPKRIEAVFAQNSGGYQKLLHDLSHEVRRTPIGRPWTEVETLLRNTAFQTTHSWDSQYTKYYQYSIKDKTWRTSDGTLHPLFLEFIVDTRSKSEVADATPGAVSSAKAGLRIELDCPLAKVLGSKTYPKKTVIFQGLRLLEVTAAAKEYRKLKEIELIYDYVGNRWVASVPQGFILTLTFGDSPKNRGGGKKLDFLAPSGLDPFEDWDGKVVQQPFTAHDTVGEFRDLGSEEWRR